MILTDEGSSCMNASFIHNTDSFSYQFITEISNVGKSLCQEALHNSWVLGFVCLFKDDIKSLFVVGYIWRFSLFVDMGVALVTFFGKCVFFDSFLLSGSD